jgi:hypothetical protein
MTNLHLSPFRHVPTPFAEYGITRMINTGSTWVVVDAVVNQTGIIYAVHLIGLLPWNESYLQEVVEREIRQLRQFDHRFIRK